MNILFIITILFLVVMMGVGLKKGFVKIAYSLLSMVLSLLLVSFFAPYVQEFLTEKTPVYEKVVEACAESIQGQVTLQNQESPDLEGYLPTALHDFLEEIEQEKEAQMDNAVLKMASSIAGWLIYAASFVISFIIVLIALRWVGSLLDLVTKLPILRGTNKLLGIFAGLVQGILILWVAALLLSVFCTTDVGQYLLTLVNENKWLQLLYNYNGIIYLAILFL